MTVRSAHDVAAFVVTGLVTVAVDAGVLVLTHTVLGWSLAIATAVAFGSSVAVNFFGHRSWAGRDSDQRVMGHAMRYGALLAINFLLTIVTVTGLAGTGLHYLAAKGVAIALTSTLSFVSYRRWVFA